MTGLEDLKKKKKENEHAKRKNLTGRQRNTGGDKSVIYITS